MYSHDSFGLGHIRRCRAIAHALASAFQGVEVLIVSGSPIIASFDFKARVDFIRVPGIVKLRNGEYESLARHRSIASTTKLRSAMIGDAALNFAPDLVIVDKEPLGLRGELLGALERLKTRGAKIVLGLRDILDEPEALLQEWERKRVYGALSDIYDAILVYGLEKIYDPLQGLPVIESVKSKVVFTGYLRRTLPGDRVGYSDTIRRDEPFILVTPGGGGDGAHMVDSVLRAYERGAPGLAKAHIVSGPFMPAEERASFEHRAKSLADVKVSTFHARMEHLMEASAGVVAMGGYNTFCEILSFDKPALLMPRTQPRREQAIRAERAASLNLASWLPEPGESGANPEKLISMLANLPAQPKPSAAKIPRLLDGIDRMTDLVGRWLNLNGTHK
jgi:predicted glycosyltransferase